MVTTDVCWPPEALAEQLVNGDFEMSSADVGYRRESPRALFNTWSDFVFLLLRCLMDKVELRYQCLRSTLCHPLLYHEWDRGQVDKCSDVNNQVSVQSPQPINPTGELHLPDRS